MNVGRKKETKMDGKLETNIYSDSIANMLAFIISHL